MKARLLGLFLLLTIIGLLALVTPVSAGPASPEVFLLTQPDGSTFEAKLWGDEWFNGLETVEGYQIMQSEDGWWVYASLTTDNKLEPALDADQAPMIVGVASTETLTPFHRPVMLTEVPEGAVAPTSQNFGSQPILVLFASFSNRGSTYPVSTFESTFFGATNSVKHYYETASFSQLTFRPVIEAWGTANDGLVGWINLGYPHPNTGSNTDQRNQKIVSDALLVADDYIDFSRYDRNFDGGISSSELHIVVIVAGYEASSGSQGPSVWAHRWSLFDALNLDGVIVGSSAMGGGYTQLGEIFVDHPATLGTFVHELGHDISWPDLYDISQLSEGVGEWSIMGSGNWNSLPGQRHGTTPALPDAWLKTYQGWFSPQKLTSYVSSAYLYHAATNKSAVVVPYNIAGVDWDYRRQSGYGEYFLVEYRRNIGYDAALPGEGVLIWHIDESVTSTNQANANRDHPLVKLLQADGADNLYYHENRGDAGDPFPGTYNNWGIQDYSNPNTRYYGNRLSDIGIWLEAYTNDYAQLIIQKGPGREIYLPLMQKNRPPVKNGDFEAGRRDWIEESVNYGRVIYMYGQDNWVADFGLANSERATLRQNSIPATGNRYLSMDIYIESEETYCGAYYDTFEIHIAGRLAEIFDLCRNSGRWFPRSYYLPNFTSDPTFNLLFTFNSDGSNSSRVLVDNIAMSQIRRVRSDVRNSGDVPILSVDAKLE